MEAFEVEQKRLELDDLIIQYPPVFQPGFQALISVKEEFASLGSKRDEPLPTQIGEYFKHQRLTHTFLRNYDNLLIMDETGTGKSASVLGFTEYCINEREKMLRNEFDFDEINAQYKRIYFIGENLQQVEFSNQLAKKINPGRYGPSAEVREKVYQNEVQRDRAFRANIKKNIKVHYEIFTYAGIINEIKTAKETLINDNKRRKLGLDDDELFASLYEKYSNCIFWLDEAHYFVTSVKGATDVANVADAGDTVGDDTGKAANKAEGYILIHELFHHIRNSKVILTTATPMINKPKDLSNIMNLILPKDGEYPLYFNPDALDEAAKKAFFGKRKITPTNFRGQMPADFDFAQVNLEDVEPYFRGRITYIRAGDIGATIEYAGVPLVPVKEDILPKNIKPLTIAYVSEMSEHQEDAYIKIKNTSGVYTEAKQAVNFVFPDGSFGEKGRKKYFEPYIDSVKDDKGNTRESEKYYRFLLTKEAHAFKNQLKNLEARTELTDSKGKEVPLGIADMSCKYASIIREIKKLEHGCAFVLSDLTEGSGLGMLSLCFEAQGYERFKEPIPVFLEKDGVRTMRETFVKKPRYAIFDGSMTSNPGGKRIIRKILDIMTSEENMDGEYIKVLLVSGVGGVGISVSSVLQIHLVSGDWNESLTYQAISRALRADAYRFLRKAYPDLELKVQIYKHAAQLVDHPKILSVDIRRYLVSEKKDRENKIVYRWMKQCAIGAIVNRVRNILPEDVDGSAACDYQECDYRAFDEIYHPELTAATDDDGSASRNLLQRDFSTYDILYAKNNINELVPAISNLYYNNNNYTLDQIDYQIQQTLGRHLRRTSIIYALEYLINKKIPIKNKFGYDAFLLEDAGNFYLDINYPTGQANYLMNYYSQNIILSKPDNLEAVTKFFNKDVTEEKTNKILTGPATGSAVKQLVIKKINFDNMTFEEKSALLEKAFTRQTDKSVRKRIIAYFKNYLFNFPPYAEGADVADSSEEPKKKGRGRPAKKVELKEKKLSAVTIADIEEDDIPVYESYKDLEAEGVLVHTFGSTKTTGANYGTTTARLKGEVIRILDTEGVEGGREYFWRDPNSEAELIYYNKLVQATNLATIIIPFRQKAKQTGGSYGIRTTEKNKKTGNLEDILKIADVAFEQAGSEANSAKRVEGQACINYKKPVIIEFLWNHGYDDAEDDNFPELPDYSAVSMSVVNDVIDKIREKSYAHINNTNWTTEKKRYFYKFLKSTGKKYATTVADLCNRLDRFLETQDLIIDF